MEKRFTVRKNKNINLSAFVGVIGIIGWVCYGVNFYIVEIEGDRSPASFLDPWFITFGFVFSAIGISIYYMTGATLVLRKIGDQQEIEITGRKGKEFELRGPFRTQCVLQHVPTGGRGIASTMPEIYLIFADAADKPVLTIKTNPGKLKAPPSQFTPVKLGSVAIANIYGGDPNGLYWAIKELA